MKLVLKALPVAIMAAMAVVAQAGGLQVSSSNPQSFTFHGDGDLLYVKPGNQGEIWFKNEPSGDPGNLQPWQDVYCDSRWLNLDSPDYDVRLSCTATTGSVEYLQRLQSFMRSCAFSGDVPIWVINDDFMDEWVAQPALLDDLASQVLTYAVDDLPEPTFIFNLSRWSNDAESLRRRLSADLPRPTISGYFADGNMIGAPFRGWAYIVCDEETIPEHYRGQAAVSWLHNRFGQIPVIISPAQPDFQQNMVWLGCGAAGVWFRPLPDAVTVGNTHGALHIRATSVYLNRFGNAHMALKSNPEHEVLQFAMEADGVAWSGVMKVGTEKARLPVPEYMQGRVVAGNWFNPATDENVIEPLTTATEETITVQPPSGSLWAYSLSLTSNAPDTESTVTAITELF